MTTFKLKNNGLVLLKMSEKLQFDKFHRPRQFKLQQSKSMHDNDCTAGYCRPRRSRAHLRKAQQWIFSERSEAQKFHPKIRGDFFNVGSLV